MARYLERTADVALIVTCILAVSWFGYRTLGSRRAPQYAQGEHLEETLRKALAQPKGPALVVKLSSHCDYCLLSVPYFKQFLERRKAGALAAPILMVSQDDPQQLQVFLKRHELAPDSVTDLRAVRSKLSEFPVPYTLLVDARGEVVRSWPGVLTETRAQEVIDSVAGLK
jgi:peroxiredoxin